jgi:hypothetical protein
MKDKSEGCPERFVLHRYDERQIRGLPREICPS